jgi:hypothetical protein
MMHHFLSQLEYHNIADIWSPIDLGDLGLWLIASNATNTGDGTNVTEWITSDSNANSFSNINSPYYPAYAAIGNNGYPTVSFTYTNPISDWEGMIHQTNAPFLLENSWTLCILFNADSTTGTYTLIGQGDYRYDNRWIAVQVDTQKIRVIQKVDNITHQATGSTNLGTGFHIATIQSWGSGVRKRGIGAKPIGGGAIGGHRPMLEVLSIRIDGAAETLTSSTNTGWGDIGSSEFTLGVYYGSIGYYSGTLKGDLQQVVVTNPRLNAADLSTLESYLATYGGITL